MAGNGNARSRGDRDAARDARRIARSEAARDHVAAMERTRSKDIERSHAGVMRFEASPKVQAEGCIPSIEMVDQDAVTVVLERGRGRAEFCDMALLDFASFTTPGGGFMRGTMAQEESLCAESTLYNVLEREREWYGENRRRHINCELYKNRGIVVPAVRFARDRVHAFADVLVVAAPNARRAVAEYNVADDILAQAMRDRIRFALSLADTLGHERLVLGAFGCGVFGWEALEVAEMFRSELASGAHVAKEVIFAIPARRFDENLPKFSHVLATFPDPNPQGYRTPVKDEPVKEKDDDDWRRYL